MKACWLFFALLLASAAAQAQMYKWVDRDGKVRYGDAPPPGAKASSVAPPAAAAAQPAAPPSKDAKDAKKGPLTPAEREQENRKRQAEAAKDEKKAAEEARAEVERKEACQRARSYLATLESGSRIQRTSANGERYFLDDGQVQSEIATSRQTIQSNCK